MLVFAHECMHALFLRRTFTASSPEASQPSRLLLAGAHLMSLEDFFDSISLALSVPRAYRQLYPLGAFTTGAGNPSIAFTTKLNISEGSSGY